MKKLRSEFEVMLNESIKKGMASDSYTKSKKAKAKVAKPKQQAIEQSIEQKLKPRKPKKEDKIIL
ncbi:MAG: hypothetical protein V1734_00090 [Nanoarchaeota archaeon]